MLRKGAKFEMNIDIVELIDCCDVMKANKETCMFYYDNDGILHMHSVKGFAMGMDLGYLNFCHNCGKQVKLKP